MEPHRRRLHARRKGPHSNAKDPHSHTKRIDIITDVVYVTASPTLGGKVVGFSTLGDPVATTSDDAPPPQVTTTPQPTATSNPSPATTESTESTSDTSSVTSDTSSDGSTSTSSTDSYETVPTPTESTLVSAPAFSQTSVPSASSSLEPKPEPVEGLSSGAKVGLALAGVMAFLVLFAAIIFIYRKKSRQRSQEAYGKPEDEKAGDGQAAVFNSQLSRTNTITSEKAPRVPSLRPVTRFLPDLTVTPPPAVNPESNTQSRQAPAANPYSGLVRSASRKAVPPPLALARSDDVPSGPPSATTTINSTAPLIGRSQPSPSASTFSAEYTDAGSSVVGTPVTAIPVAAAASNTSPVHRVQMDFKPSMGDELELRVGQLVRLLHEYDDGWALCIRLDRSQQGVCPRTCLSQRPVKPRPQGPPQGARGPPRAGYGPNSRPQSPMGNRGPPRPYSPAGGPRAQSPGPNGIQFPHPRPQSPANSRPQSPAGGYAKRQYRPAMSSQAIPIAPVQPPPAAVSQSIPAVLRSGPARVTLTTDIPDGGPAMPTSAMPKQQSPPGSPPRPAVAPVRPSPLSHEQNSGAEPQQTQPVFHAM